MPQRFRFRLQPVLEQRERIEQDRAVAVAQLERQRIGLEERLRQIQSGVMDAREGLRDHLRRGVGAASAIPMVDVRLQANSTLHLTLMAQRIAIELAGVLQRLEAARRDLVRAAAERKAVQLLKERQAAEHALEARRREQRDLDDLTTMRHGRRTGPVAATGALQ